MWVDEALTSIIVALMPVGLVNPADESEVACTLFSRHVGRGCGAERG